MYVLISLFLYFKGKARGGNKNRSFIYWCTPQAAPNWGWDELKARGQELTQTYRDGGPPHTQAVPGTEAGSSIRNEAAVLPAALQDGRQGCGECLHPPSLVSKGMVCFDASPTS